MRLQRKPASSLSPTQVLAHYMVPAPAFMRGALSRPTRLYAAALGDMVIHRMQLPHLRVFSSARPHIMLDITWLPGGMALLHIRRML